MKTVQPGDCVRLADYQDSRLFQVINVREDNNRCWVRVWPLHPKLNPVFEVDLSCVGPVPC